MIQDPNAFSRLYDVGDTPSDCIRRGVFYEEDIFLKFKDKIPADGNILDIGANIGNHSVMFWQYFPNSKIVSFEANPFNYCLLAHNTKYKNNIKAICCALSDKVELVEFVHFHPSPGCSRLPQYYGDSAGDVPGETSMFGVNINDCIKVNIITQQLDAFNFEEEISFIKIDVERHEIAVFEGGKNLIEKYKPTIWIEDNKYETDRRHESSVQYLVDKFGYLIVDEAIDGNYLLK
jgi:FkbM family methyltransferase